MLFKLIYSLMPLFCFLFCFSFNCVCYLAFASGDNLSFPTHHFFQFCTEWIPYICPSPPQYSELSSFIIFLLCSKECPIARPLPFYVHLFGDRNLALHHNYWGFFCFPSLSLSLFVKLLSYLMYPLGLTLFCHQSLLCKHRHAHRKCCTFRVFISSRRTDRSHQATSETWFLQVHMHNPTIALHQGAVYYITHCWFHDWPLLGQYSVNKTWYKITLLIWRFNLTHYTISKTAHHGIRTFLGTNLFIPVLSGKIYILSQR